MKNLLYTLFISLCFVATSCDNDQLFADYGPIGEGLSEVTAEIQFKSYTPALDGSRADGSPGDILNGIDNLYLFVYNEDGSQLIYNPVFTKETGLTVIKDNTNKPSDAEGVTPGVKTDRAKFKFPIIYGRYKIYAVANVRGEYTEKFARKNVQNESALKAQKFAWDAEKIGNNDQMFGSFYTTDPSDTPADRFDAEVITINKPGMTLSAWMRRLASKVTIDYDPSGLNEGVTIWIKKATIYHIADSCVVGASNVPTVNDLLAKGQSIDYREEPDYDDESPWKEYMRLQKASGIKGSDHSDDANALFFYENNQGDKKGQGEAYKKVQNKKEMDELNGNPDIKWNKTGGGDENYGDYKDKVPAGTFIEVEAQYLSKNAARPSEGPIIYRFMLGKDVEYNYDAERNYHYKLTLRFRGWANQPDWHIDYTEPDPGIMTPDEYFISYLYNQTMSMPVRLTNIEDNDIVKVRAEIIENNWAPYDPQTKGVPASEDVGTDFSWNLDAYNFLKDKYDSPTYNGKANFVGFLSLRRLQENQDVTIAGDGYGEEAMTRIMNNYVDNEQYYAEYDISETTEGKQILNGKNRDDGTYSVTHDGNEVILQVPMWTRALTMSVMSGFTGNNPYDAYRRKAIVRFTAYNSQGQQVNFKTIEGEEKEYKDVPIYQVRRVVNPKAIWRQHDNDQPFNIKLKVRQNPSGTNFVDLTSQGAWRASIITDDDNLIEISKGSSSVTTKGKYIEGSTGSIIEFDYKPRGTVKSDASRSGIIMVEYNDYTCFHYIFVKQGYNKEISLGGKKWSNFSVYAMNGTVPNSGSWEPEQKTGSSTVNVRTTVSPLSLGTMFKRGNYSAGIAESNTDIYGLYDPIYDKPLKVLYLDANNDVKSRNDVHWYDIGGYGWKSYDGTGDRIGNQYSWIPTLIDIDHGNKMEVPTYENFQALQRVDQGYGVVYGDGATKTASTTTLAYGFTDINNNNNNFDAQSKTGGSEAGIRACIVYDSGNAEQVMFPMGEYGQGRRTRQIIYIGNSKMPGIVASVNGNSKEASTRLQSEFQRKGTICYSGVYGVLSGTANQNNNYRPIVYNLYRNPGALYWIKVPKPNGHVYPTPVNSASWDINYFSADFGPYDNSSLGDGISVSNLATIRGEVLEWNNLGNSGQQNYRRAQCSDALPIRLIYQ